MNNILGMPRIDYVFEYHICAICGYSLQYHFFKRHKFIETCDDRRCTKCDKYFYEHSHSDDGCTFVSKKYIQT
jgi:hypothetical protein